MIKIIKTNTLNPFDKAYCKGKRFEKYGRTFSSIKFEIRLY